MPQPTMTRGARTYRYYKSTLDACGKEAYDAIADGVFAFEKEIRLPAGMTNDDARTAFLAFINDFPFAFHLEHSWQWSSRARWGIARTCLMPTYRLSPPVAAEVARRLDARATEVTRRYSHLDRYGQVAAFHDWILANYEYDGSGPEYRDSAPGALIYGTSVCSGVSHGMKALCDYARIECAVASGMLLTDTGSEPHAWNVVNLGESGRNPRWGIIDVTNDGSCIVADGARYTYFGMSDSQARHMLVPDSDLKAPPCPQGVYYYARMGLVAGNQQELKRILGAETKKGKHVEFAFGQGIRPRSTTEAMRHIKRSVPTFSRFAAFTVSYDEHTGACGVTFS